MEVDDEKARKLIEADANGAMKALRETEAKNPEDLRFPLCHAGSSPRWRGLD